MTFCCRNGPVGETVESVRDEQADWSTARSQCSDLLSMYCRQREASVQHLNGQMCQGTFTVTRLQLLPLVCCLCDNNPVNHVPDISIIIIIINSSSSSSSIRWRVGAIDRASYLRLRGRGFSFQPGTAA